MSTTVKQTTFWSLFTLAHAGLTVLLFLLYVNYAMKVDHGLLEPTTTGTIAQYLKSIVFLPILLPVLRWRADLATGPWGYLLVLLNSAVWALACWWVWRRLRLRRPMPSGR